MDQAKLIDFDLDSFSDNSNENRDKNVISLYPYHSTNLVIGFVYGIGSKRQRYRDTFTERGVSMMIYGTFTCAVSALLLCYVRQRFNLHRSGFGASYIDTCIVFGAGGNLVLNHRWERIIFGILFIGFFFFTTFWLEAVVFPTFLIHDGSIDSFDQLKKMNAPTFCSTSLQKSEKNIEDLLRLALEIFNSQKLTVLFI